MALLSPTSVIYNHHVALQPDYTARTLTTARRLPSTSVQVLIAAYCENVTITYAYRENPDSNRFLFL